ncbi:eotaxin-like [Chionomys nivalis]|uniref:eotaxin-like n=1 Tax=Chionomys nivalis TaxID=269649 RepID=UPI002595BF78|nr:eotaxin-like [Chionomys nivalis]
MQISTGLLCLLLVVTAFTSQVLAHPGSIPASCCFVMTSKKIPKQLLKSYKKITNSRCTQKAIVFKTKLGKDICADPKQKWVQDATKYLDQILRTPKP